MLAPQKFKGIRGASVGGLVCTEGDYGALWWEAVEVAGVGCGNVRHRWKYTAGPWAAVPPSRIPQQLTRLAPGFHGKLPGYTQVLEGLWQGWGSCISKREDELRKHRRSLVT